MNAGRYTIKSFLTDHNLQQILIPEIQRDYVWKIENVDKLIDSIVTDANKEAPKQSIAKEMWDMMPVELQDQLSRTLESQKTFTNVGFLYAYHDSEIPDRYMLIDGQQRITTIFLILLAVHIRDGKATQFTRHYFSNELIKLDYRVRENSHNFLFDFANFILRGGRCEETTDQYWYYNAYKQDQTVQSLYRNFLHIAQRIEIEKLELDYIENHIEFWYFDTNLSAQGEELYLYMNSRGESVQANENIKANLLESISEGEKRQWGEKWEEWQQIFWLNRQDGSPNADLGFDEFLKWIKIIENTKSGNLEKANSQTDYIKTIKESKTFTIVGLDMKTIERYIHTLKRILDMEIDDYFNSNKLNGEVKALDYVLYLPLLAFVDANPELEIGEVRRFAHFFFNASRFEVISKNPYMHIAQALGITRQMINEGQRDVAEIRHLPANRYDNLLTPEERMKFAIYVEANNMFSRTEIELAFWEAESLGLCEGRIKILWDTMEFELIGSDVKEFDFNKFRKYLNAAKELFDEPCDLLRRALLTKGNYGINNGYTNSLEGHRYSFGYDNWKDIFGEYAALGILKSFMTDYVEKSLSIRDRDNILNDIISKYLLNETGRDWIYYFVKQPTILNYCRQKMVCFSGDKLSDVYLLQERKAATHNYRELKNFLSNF
jgi:hypothetical protein